VALGVGVTVGVPTESVAWVLPRRWRWRRTLSGRSENSAKAAYCGPLFISVRKLIEILVGAAFLARPGLTAICVLTAVPSCPTAVPLETSRKGDS